MKPQDLNSHELTCPHCQKRLAYVPPIGFALTHGPADAQALADMRTLDECTTSKSFWRIRPIDSAGFECVNMVWSDVHRVFQLGECFRGPTTDAARHAAAEWVRSQR